MNDNISKDLATLPLVASLLSRSGPLTYRPAYTPAEAFQAAQDAAVAATLRLKKKAMTQADMERLAKDGTVGFLATYCAVPELARFADGELVYGFAEVIAERVIDCWQGGCFVENLPRPISETPVQQHQSEKSADHGVADAVTAVRDHYAACFSDTLPFDPLSKETHDILVRRGRLVAYDVLKPNYFPNAAAVMAEIIAEVVWQECAGQLAHSVTPASTTDD